MSAIRIFQIPFRRKKKRWGGEAEYRHEPDITLHYSKEVKMMTVNNMARNAMMTGAINGTNPLLGAQAQKTPAMPTPQPSFGENLQVSPKSSFTTGTEVRSAGGDLQSAVQNRQTAFAQQQAVTSNAKTATATVDNAKLAQGTASSLQSNPINLNVKQTATAQTNAGSAMGADAKDVKAGEYSFAIEAGGETHNFTIKVDENDTNASIQEKMAAAINERDIGVNASVTATEAADGKEATTSLSLTSAATGTDSAFTVKEDPGGIASAMGIAGATQNAQNAIYSVNGCEDITSQSNDVSLTAGVTATLTGSGSASISLERDSKSAVDGIRGLVDSINSALKSAGENEGRGSTRFVSDIQTMNKSYSASLEKMGIAVAKDGSLSIVDEDKLAKATADGSADRLFADKRFGFGARLDKIADNAAKTDLYADIQANFKFDRGQLMFQKMQNVGILFNMLF